MQNITITLDEATAGWARLHRRGKKSTTALLFVDSNVFVHSIG